MALTDIPVPGAAPAGGRTVASMNALAQLVKQHLENQYYAPIAQANAMSKTAYAQYAPAEAAAKFLQGGGAKYLSPQENAEMAQRVRSSVSGNAMNSVMEAFKPKENFLDMALNKLTSILNPSDENDKPQQQRGNALNFDQSVPESGRQQVNAFNGNPGDSMVVPGTNPQNSLGYGTPAAQQANQMQIPGTQGGTNPEVAGEAQKEAALATAKEQAATAEKQWNAAQTQASGDQSAGTTLIKSGQMFSNAYDKSKYTGSYKGMIPSSGFGSIPWSDMSEEQKADNAVKNMQAAIAPIIAGGGHVSDQARTLSGELKVYRSLDKEAKRALSESAISLGERMRQKANFYNQIRRKNPDILNPEADALWDDYQNQYPAFDTESFKSLPSNNKKWIEYTKPEVLNQYRNAGSVDLSPKDTSRVVIKGDPKWGDITENDLKATMKAENKIMSEVLKELGH